MVFHILKALSGDCFIVDFENGKCILIDGGYKSTFPELKLRLQELRDAGKRLEYVILTHYDSDHISGLIAFMEQNGQKGEETIIPVDAIICNNFTNLYKLFPLREPLSSGQMSFRQQKTFEELCVQNGWTLPNDSVVTNMVFHGDGYKIRIISPSQESLERCRQCSKYIIRHKNPGSTAGKIYSDISAWKNEKEGAELNFVNKASLAFEVVYNDKKLLFCGDADMSRYKYLLHPNYDVIKLSHHGTYKGNECFCGKGAITAKDYIISTNGNKPEHPNRKLLCGIIMQPGKKRLLMNYDLSKGSRRKNHLLFDAYQNRKYSFKSVITHTFSI